MITFLHLESSMELLLISVFAWDPVSEFLQLMICQLLLLATVETLSSSTCNPPHLTNMQLFASMASVMMSWSSLCRSLDIKFQPGKWRNALKFQSSKMEPRCNSEELMKLDNPSTYINQSQLMESVLKRNSHHKNRPSSLTSLQFLPKIAQQASQQTCRSSATTGKMISNSQLIWMSFKLLDPSSMNVSWTLRMASGSLH